MFKLKSLAQATPVTEPQARGGQKRQSFTGPAVIFITVLLIDASSSMDSDDYSPSRLAAAKKGGLAYVRYRHSISPSDRAAVVSFNGAGHVACPLVELRGEHRVVEQALDGIGADGCTSIGEGLKAAEALLIGTPPSWLTRLLGEPLRVLLPSGSVKRVILLSDGGNNSGTNPVAVAQRLKAAGVDIDCIGIGARDDVNEKLLKKLATSPDRYRFIADAQDLFEHYCVLAKSLTV